MELMLLFVLAYVVGTVFGYWIGNRSGFANGVVATIESLVEEKFLRTRTRKGELEIIKYNEE